MKAPRLRTLTLWTGSLLSLLIVAAFVASGFWFVAVQAPTPYGPCLWLTPGSVTIVLDAPMNEWVFVEHKVYVEPEARLWLWTSLKSLAAGSRFVELPLYAVFAAVAIPTLLVWRFGPKPVKPGHCGCGYDLTGNTSGVCPECGTAARTPS